MNEINLALQILPLVDSAEVYRIMDKVIEYIKNTGIKYYVTPFETVLEGSIDELLKIVKGVQNLCFQLGVIEFVANIKIHSIKDKDVLIETKMANYL